MRATAAFLFVAYALAGCGPNVIEVRSTEGSYVAEFPGVPARRTEHIPLPDGGKLNIHFDVREYSDRAYAIGWADFPEEIVDAADPDELLEGAASGVGRGRGRIVGKRKMTVSGCPGIELAIDAKLPGVKQAAVMVRVCLSENRLYLVMFAGEKKRAARPDVTAFLDSFRIESAVASPAR